MNFLYLFSIIGIATLLPLFELRLSIPLGIILLGLPVIPVVMIAIFANIVAGVLAYYCVDLFIWLATRISFIDRLYQHYLKKTQRKIHPLVERWGILGLSIFIGIPLPVSGVYTGAFGAKIIGMDFKEFLISSIVGVCMAALIVLMVTLLFQGFLSVIGFNQHNIELFRSIFGL